MDFIPAPQEPDDPTKEHLELVAGFTLHINDYLFDMGKKLRFTEEDMVDIFATSGVLLRLCPEEKK